jgi:hypothetical protein
MDAPSFSPHLFWDTNPLQTDWHAQAEAVLIRVFNRGSLEDVIEAERFYGLAPIRELLQQPRLLSLEGRRLAEVVLNTL